MELTACDPDLESHRAQHSPTDSPPKQPLRPADTIHCVICSDFALPARILEALPERMARVQFGSNIEEVNVELIDAEVGEIVLIQARVAIGKLRIER